MKNLYLLSLFFLSTLLSAQVTAKVIGISDGDTITVLLENQTQLKLRLAEVDCPENGQPFGKNAKLFTSNAVFGKWIIFYETDKDRYGRIVAKVYFDSKKYLSEEIIKGGLGWWYYQYSDNKYLEELQDLAKSKGLGLWSDKKAISPYEWRKQHKTK